MTDLFDIKSILKNTPDKDKLYVTLKKTEKGNSLFATKPIKKGDTIAYYKMMVFSTLKTEPLITEIKSKCAKLGINKAEIKKIVDSIENVGTLSYKNKAIKVPYGQMYNFTVYNKNGYYYKSLIGDLYKGSLPLPKNNIPYWAYFSNEPSIDKKENSTIDTQPYENYTKLDRVSLKEGDTITYALKATSDIEKGEEIVWCYGKSYKDNRNYETICK